MALEATGDVPLWHAGFLWGPFYFNTYLGFAILLIYRISDNYTAKLRQAGFRGGHSKNLRDQVKVTAYQPLIVEHSSLSIIKTVQSMVRNIARMQVGDGQYYVYMSDTDK